MILRHRKQFVWLCSKGLNSVNANELVSELFKFVKFYSSYLLIPRLYNTLRSISKNLVLVETFERKYFIECPKWLLQRLFFDFHYLFDFCAKKKKKISKNLSNFPFFTIMGSPEFWFHSQTLDQFWVSITAVAQV